MAFENLIPGHRLTEADVIGVLKEGDAYRDWIRGRMKRNEQERSTYEELIRNSALRAGPLSEVITSGSGNAYDSVFHTWQDANSMLREEAAYFRKQQQNVRFAGIMITRIWDSFYHMDPQLQEILTGFYIRRECAQNIADRLEISLTTFWRKRKTAVSYILNECSGSEMKTVS